MSIKYLHGLKNSPACHECCIVLHGEHHVMPCGEHHVMHCIQKTISYSTYCRAIKPNYVVYLDIKYCTLISITYCGAYVNVILYGTYTNGNDTNLFIYLFNALQCKY